MVQLPKVLYLTHTLPLCLHLSASSHSAMNRRTEHYIMTAIGITLVVIGAVVTFAVRRTNAPASAKVYVTERI